MSATVMKTGEKPAASAVVDPAEPHNSPKYYRGFVGGVFSGIAKLSGTYIYIHTHTAFKSIR
jgi:solute carrier family 25 carnitine/acylcarnitine transporter 20/29